MRQTIKKYFFASGRNSEELANQVSKHLKENCELVGGPMRDGECLVQAMTVKVNRGWNEFSHVDFDRAYARMEFIERKKKDPNHGEQPIDSI